MTTKAEQERTMTHRQLEAHRQANRRYHLTDKGRETDRRRRQRRIWCGRSYKGMARSIEDAQELRELINRMFGEFKQRQAEETKVGATSASGRGNYRNYKGAPDSDLISLLGVRVISTDSQAWRPEATKEK
jgi:hypothetical protein